MKSKAYITLVFREKFVVQRCMEINAAPFIICCERQLVLALLNTRLNKGIVGLTFREQCTLVFVNEIVR